MRCVTDEELRDELHYLRGCIEMMKRIRIDKTEPDRLRIARQVEAGHKTWAKRCLVYGPKGLKKTA